MPLSLSTTTTATTTILLFIVILSTASSAVPIIGLDSFLSQQYSTDPRATNDSFQSLSSALRSSLSSHSNSLSPLSLLASLSLTPSLHVRLVSNSLSPAAAALLDSFIAAAKPAGNFHVISTSDRTLTRRLAAAHVLHLDVAAASPSLASRVSKAIAGAIAGKASSLQSGLASVDFSAVDDVIREDFEKEKPVHGVFLYFLDLGQQSKPYAYGHGGGESSPAFSRCLGTVWSGKERYVWVDLGAGPVDYGPAISGDGVLPRGEFHPLATLHGRPKSEKSLVADLASLVSSAYQVLLVPSLRIPVPFETSLIVQFIHVYGVENGDPSGLDWKLIERTFRDENELLLGEQSLVFKNYKVSYSKCPICSFAISRSTNSFTSRFLFNNYTMIVNEYLDSKRLHRILSDSAEEFRRVAFIPEEDFGRVVPVYVFDLDIHSILLLDRYHQSVAFKDMVIAVRTKNTQTVSDYSCNGRHVFTQARELERPIVGSILQSMWGVSPTHMTWSPQHNSTLVDYTWSIGQTPFGPFSESLSLSFVQKDAARRNIILTSMNNTVMSAVDVLQSVAAHGGERKFLKDNQRIEYTQRLNLLKYKLDKAISALSRLDFDLALYYLRSSDHDLYGIHSIVYTASQEMEASLVCFEDPPFPWFSASLSATAFLMLFYVYAKRDKLFRNKRKQF